MPGMLITVVAGVGARAGCSSWPPESYSRDDPVVFDMFITVSSTDLPAGVCSGIGSGAETIALLGVSVMYGVPSGPSAELSSGIAAVDIVTGVLLSPLPRKGLSGAPMLIICATFFCLAAMASTVAWTLSIVAMSSGILLSVALRLYSQSLAFASSIFVSNSRAQFGVLVSAVLAHPWISCSTRLTRPVRWVLEGVSGKSATLFMR